MRDADFVIEPSLVKLNYEGWMAKTMPHTKIRIGVVGANEVEARERFFASLKRWKEIHESKET